MNKKIITSIFILGIFILVCATIFNFNKKDNNLKKVKVADTTLTSWTYMSSSKLFISKLERMKYAI